MSDIIEANSGHRESFTYAEKDFDCIKEKVLSQK